MNLSIVVRIQGRREWLLFIECFSELHEFMNKNEPDR